MLVNNRNKMDPAVVETAENVLYNLWYSVAEKIFKRVIEITQLDEEQVKALKQACLRPNDFRIKINGIPDMDYDDELNDDLKDDNKDAFP